MVDNVDDCKKGIFFGASTGASNNKAYPGPEFNTLDEVENNYTCTYLH